jgi:hypothetical protein
LSKRDEVVNDPRLLFEVQTPLNFAVRTTTHVYWARLITKHPDLADRIDQVKQTLVSPFEIRRSSRDAGVLLFYRQAEGFWVVAVARRSGVDGFLVTAYRTDARKEGDRIWP